VGRPLMAGIDVERLWGELALSAGCGIVRLVRVVQLLGGAKGAAPATRWPPAVECAALLKPHVCLSSVLVR
jgi:hypothetical protein